MHCPLLRNVPDIIYYRNQNKVKHQALINVFSWLFSHSHFSVYTSSKAIQFNFMIILMHLKKFADVLHCFSTGWKREENEEYGGAYEGNWTIAA